MKLSVSNLAWGSLDFEDLLTVVGDHGMHGVEIAPTAIWPDSPEVTGEDLARIRAALDSHELQVSGFQSLLYRRPDLQLLGPETWPALLDHLRRIIGLAGQLQASCAVFGSPRNRIRADLSVESADALAAEFFGRLEPTLQDAGVVLTLEPNAPEYGADYLTGYPDVVRLADLVDSPWVQPQIDTGCLAMVHQDAASAARLRQPGHVHVSAPQLQPPVAGPEHDALAAVLRAHDYQGWVVLEMLPAPGDPRAGAIDTMRWMRDVYGDGS